ncbi:hypothetical protein [Streptomyces sp. OP7]|uniref:hypothetical protein n=1 Tax=Streptomyces sp. OP7 TaxID=3142462 RepID=UPI0032E864AA
MLGTLIDEPAGIRAGIRRLDLSLAEHDTDRLTGPAGRRRLGSGAAAAAHGRRARLRPVRSTGDGYALRVRRPAVGEHPSPADDFDLHADSLNALADQLG